MSQPGMCQWCAKQIPLSLIDADGVATRISGKPGTVQHHRDDAWWPCEAITYGWKKCPDCEEGTREIETNGPAGTMTMGCETCNQSGFISALAVPPAPPTGPEEQFDREAIRAALKLGFENGWHAARSGDMQDAWEDSTLRKRFDQKTCELSLPPAPLAADLEKK